MQQQTFQSVLTTDGKTSFVLFTYNDPGQITNITSDPRGIGLIGFDAGDLRSAVVRNSEHRTFPLQQTNAFRIDGKRLYSTASLCITNEVLATSKS